MSEAAAPCCVSIDVLEYENGSLRLDGSADSQLLKSGRLALCLRDGRGCNRSWQDRESVAVFCEDDGNGGDSQTQEHRHGVFEIPVRLTERYAQVTVDKETITDRQSFAAEVPAAALAKDHYLEFRYYGADGFARVLPILAAPYQARLHSELSQCWWSFQTDDEKKPRTYMVTWGSGKKRPCGSNVTEAVKTGNCAPEAGVTEAAKNDNCAHEADVTKIDGVCGKEESGLPCAWRIRRVGKGARMAQELRFLKEILCAKNGSKKMFLMRCSYWLSYPFYAKKNIWITFDKLYKGGDCGEYFYKYMCSRAREGVVPVYVIRKDAPDYERLKSEGYAPSPYRSKKQRLSYLFASMVFGTHSGVNSFCGFNNWEVRFVQDRLRAANTCIQHGLSVQDLRADSNRAVNNNKRYYCASHCEIENLMQAAYDYKPEMLRLTGIPRYDGLVNDDKRQILITPTWRSYLAVHSVMGEMRGYNPEFQKTQYFQIYQSLLENERLIGTAKQCGYKIIYLLHPVLSAQKKDFRSSEGIEIRTALEVNYEQILTQSSLMVTDYSGVQFDFAYMRKPVVYFHPKDLPPHYGDGGFSYGEQGFGEICIDMENLTETLCAYMENGCMLKEEYRRRQDAFFAYNDRESCRRIYEDAQQYQRERRRGGRA